jgi:hypothetical protein
MAPETGALSVAGRTGTQDFTSAARHITPVGRPLSVEIPVPLEAERHEERSRVFVRFNPDYLVYHGPHAQKGRASVMPTFTRILIALCVGAAAILVWQSYGDAARRIIASSFSQLGWMAPRTTPIAYGPSDQRRFTAISTDLDAIRQLVDRIAVAQEQITRDFDQLMGSQEQLMYEISKLNATEHQNRGTNSEPQPAAPLSLARKPIPRSTHTLTVR